MQKRTGNQDIKRKKERFLIKQFEKRGEKKKKKIIIKQFLNRKQQTLLENTH